MRKITADWRCLVALLIITITIFLLTKPTVSALAEVENIPIAPVIATEKIPQILLDISYAESHDNQNKVGHNYRYRTVKNEEGKLVKEKYLWSNDIGRFQINDFYNKEYCKDAGFNIYTEEGNRGCALKLYKEKGTQPWNASKYCWSEIEACKAKRGGDYK